MWNTIKNVIYTILIIIAVIASAIGTVLLIPIVLLLILGTIVYIVLEMRDHDEFN